MNITAVVAADLVAIALLVVVMLSNSWRIHQRDTESRFLAFLGVLGVLSCLIDSLASAFDGTPGGVAHVLLFLGNTLIYASGPAVFVAWLMFVSRHCNVPMSKLHRGVVASVCALLALCLVINIFTPVVFSESANNVYSRGSLYVLFLVVDGLLLVDSIGTYYRARFKGGLLRTFPIWVFIIPVLLGASVQTFLYGVSLMWPMMVVAITGVMSSLQNELIFHDGLTNLFNRVYLDNLKRRYNAKSDAAMTAVMIDLNGFKSVNDRFGHAVGDEALIQVATVLRRAVGTSGTAIRYAGDEFVLILNTIEEVEICAVMDKVKADLKALNEEPDREYELSIAYGYATFDLGSQNIDELMNIVDKRMYEDKIRYYKTHDRRNR